MYDYLLPLHPVEMESEISMSLKHLLLLVVRATWALHFEKDRENVMRFLAADLEDRWGVDRKELRKVMEEIGFPLEMRDDEEEEMCDHCNAQPKKGGDLCADCFRDGAAPHKK
jgi:hypothetical protein